MSQVSNFIDVKNQVILTPVNSYVANYQTKIFFNGSDIFNLRRKIITHMTAWTNSNVNYIDSLAVVNVANTDFSTYLTLVGTDGKVIINLMPLINLIDYEMNEASQKTLRQFLMVVDWPKSYMLLVWTASPVAGSAIAIKVSYVDDTTQLPDHVKRNIH